MYGAIWYAWVLRLFTGGLECIECKCTHIRIYKWLFLKKALWI